MHLSRKPVLHKLLRAAAVEPVEAAAGNAGAIRLVDGGNGERWTDAPVNPSVQPVVLLLNRGSRSVAQAAQQAGVQAVCWKPVRPASLRAAVATAAGLAPADVIAGDEQARWDNARAGIPSGARVLVAEDHPSNRIVIRKMLERLGIDPVLVDDGQMALEQVMLAQADRKPFDLVITDCHMPVCDGFEFTRQVRALEADQRTGARLPIVALSASVLQEEIRSCYDAGMDDFLPKPLDPVSLQAVLQNWLSDIGAGGKSVAVQPVAVPAAESHPVLDIRQYVELFGGLTEEVVSIARGYADGTRQQLVDLDDALAAGNRGDAIRFVHLIAGGSLTIGAMRLGEQARAIEMMLRADNIEGARTASKDLPALFEAVDAEIAVLQPEAAAAAD
jgi:CheY-like chemotaxis protein/HPt (histidine-containing phosphotransfer) domain-containing protein